MSNNKILKCSCENEFQDKKYGKGNRIFNKYIKGYRCTVCEKEIIDGSTSTDKKAKSKEDKK